MDQVNYTVQKAWKAPHFVMRVLKKGNRYTRILAYTTFVRPIPEHTAAYCNPYIEREINALYRVQSKAAPFTPQTKDSDGETVAMRRTIARLCVLSKIILGSGLRKVKAIVCEVLTI